MQRRPKPKSAFEEREPMSRELVERAMDGDSEAFGVLASRALDRLVGTASLILGDRSRAEDATQNALMRAWRDLPTLRKPDRFDAWLYRILVRSCHDQIRAERRERVRPGHPWTPLTQPDGIADVADRDALAHALARLTHEQRTIVVLHYYLGLSHSQIADATRLPLGTVKSRLSRSLSYLQAALAADARIGQPEGRA
jgi:RNA polymerase sigma-70 factor (ECF subfamily)